jgi:DNA-directed RNA polymerase specialized sigma24 family protein
VNIPKGMTENEVVEIIDKVAKGLAPIYRFGYHTIEDMRQQAKIIAIEGLDKYDANRPLENFLWTHVRNRLYNFKRDNYERPDKPCFNCPFNAYDPGLKQSDNGCSLHLQLINCEPYSQWYNRNAPKRNLMNPTDIDNINDEKEKNTKVTDENLEAADTKIVFETIDKHLPINMREDYIKMKFGIKIPKKRREEILESIRSILNSNGIRTEEEG